MIERSKTVDTTQSREPVGSAFWLTTVALLVSGALSASAHAAKTEITPRLDVGAIHETNPRLSRTVEDEATGVIAEGIARMSWASQRTEWSFDPRLRLWRYPDSNDSDLENNDLWLPLEFSYTGKRTTANALVEYSDVGVRTTEIESADSGPGGGSTNVQFAGDQRRQFRFQPDWSLQLTQRDVLSVGATFLDTKFSEQRAGRLDFRYLGGNVGWQHSIGPKMALGVQGQVSRFKSESNVAKNDPVGNQGLATENDTTTFTGSVFVDYQFSETLTGSVYFGGSGTDAEITTNPFLDIVGTPFCIDADSNIGEPPCTEEFSNEAYTGSATLKKSSERTQYTASVSRGIIPSARGAETLRDEIRIRARHSFTRSLSANAGVLWFNESIAAAADGGDFKRDYISINVNLEWRFARYLGLRGAYRFVEVDNSRGTNRKTDNNYFFVGVFYGGQNWRL
jgi:hypothetical protein